MLQPSTESFSLEANPSSEDDEKARADKRNLDYLRDFWNSCTDEKSIDAYGAEPLYDAVDHIVQLWRGKGVRPEDEGHDDDEDEDADDDSAISIEDDDAAVQSDDDLIMAVDDAGQMAWINKNKKHHKKHNHGKDKKKHHDKKQHDRYDRYDPRTKKERLTNTLMWMHARGKAHGATVYCFS